LDIKISNSFISLNIIWLDLIILRSKDKKVILNITNFDI
jgi:hypothetical protein